MCGIVGYVGWQRAVPILLEGLRRLEYRGYDSAGLATPGRRGLQVVKRAGRIEQLEAILDGRAPDARVGIAHTRWATHGPPTDANAHPHTDCAGRLAVVHNGIIENAGQLRRELEARGHRFASETDTEVLAHLIEAHYRGDLAQAVRLALQGVRGSYAIAVVCQDEPDRLVVARQDSPLVIGLGRGENLVASDIPALLRHTRDLYVLEDGEMAVLTADRVAVYRLADPELRPMARRPLRVEWDLEQAEKGGYPDFMLKEICEQPQAVRQALGGRLVEAGGGRLAVDLGEAALSGEELRRLRRVAIVACGTAYHAGLVGKALLERWTDLQVEAELASEFRYREPRLGPDTLVVLVSQSGETADTLAALREARRQGARTLGVVNVVGSTLAREAERVLYTRAGPEIAVASTKAYLTQLACLTLWAIDVGGRAGHLDPGHGQALLRGLQELPRRLEEVLAGSGAVAELARSWAERHDVFFIGRGLDYLVAMEGQLKLKEISYLHAEALPAGELKHGTLALIAPGVPVVALATQRRLYDKMASNVQEVKARGAEVWALTFAGNGALGPVDHRLDLPDVPDELAPAVSVVPLQLLAYHVARARGCDVDKPRNLAKSVTVE